MKNDIKVIQKMEIRPGTDRTVCACCKKQIDRGDQFAADLKSGDRVCGECALQVRILYPVDYTWAFVLWDSDEVDKGGYEDTPLSIDPLNEMDLPGFTSAMQEAERERAARRSRYGDGKAYFRVDNHQRIIKDIGKGRRSVTEEFAVSGTVLLGDAHAKSTVHVARREGSYSFPVGRLEVPIGDHLRATKPSEIIHEGCHGVIILKEDASCIYPGDILTID